MSTRNAKTIAALTCLLAAWGVLFLAYFLAVDSFAGLPPWVPLVLTLPAGALIAVSGASRRTRGAVALAILLVVGAIASFGLSAGDSQGLESDWYVDESRRISSTLYAVGEEVRRLEAFSSSLGEQIAQRLLARGRHDDSRQSRLWAFGMLDTLANDAMAGGVVPSGTRIGIQLFDGDGGRFAWSGWPQSTTSVDEQFVSSGTELVYTRRISLYRILSHVIPLSVDGEVTVVLVDIPLEVNYRVNNKFLKSTSLADNIRLGRARGRRQEP